MLTARAFQLFKDCQNHRTHFQSEPILETTFNKFVFVLLFIVQPSFSWCSLGKLPTLLSPYRELYCSNRKTLSCEDILKTPHQKRQKAFYRLFNQVQVSRNMNRLGIGVAVNDHVIYMYVGPRGPVGIRTCNV